MVDEVNTGNRRRVIMRRRVAGGGSFSQGTSTRSESLRASDDPGIEPDEVDDAVDPEQAVDRIRTGRMLPPSHPATPDAERDNPRMRLNQVGLAGSAAYAKEFRLELLNRLLMRKIPLDQIATQLQVSISTVEKDRAELGKRLREAAKALNIEEIVGGQNAIYDEIRGMALRVASAGPDAEGRGGTPTPMRLAAMRTALAAEADRTRFNNTAGVYDVLRFRRSEDGSNVSDVMLLMQRTEELLAQLDAPEEEIPPAKPPKSGGFKSLSFDDVDASGSANEVQEL